MYNWLDQPFLPYPIRAEGRRKRRRREVDGEKSESYAVEAVEVQTSDNGGPSDVIARESREERAWYDDDDDDDDENDDVDDADNDVDGQPDRAYTLDDIRVRSPQNLAHSRFTLYKGLEMLASTSGVPGRPCLLRSICETAEAPFTYRHGVLGELAHLIMT